jgi:hypothetical protein
MSAVDVVLQVFRSVEERNPQLAAEVYHDDLEFHWPRPLPYAGSSYGLKASLERRPGWAGTWDPLQGQSDRGLGARVVASSEDEVVVLWHQRGRDHAGRGSRRKARPGSDVLLRSTRGCRIPGSGKGRELGCQAAWPAQMRSRMFARINTVNPRPDTENTGVTAHGRLSKSLFWELLAVAGPTARPGSA